MNISLFTAEASLYDHKGNYRSAGLFSRGAGVFPQACNEKCLTACAGGCPYPWEAPPAALRACMKVCEGKCGCLPLY
jgi:hypothetical protein